MFGSGPDTLPDVRMDLLDVRKWSRVPPGCPGLALIPYRMFERTSRRSGRTFPDIREWSEGLPGCTRVVGRPSRMSESGRDALPDVW